MTTKADSNDLLYMGTQFPDWATDKQREGMKKFITIAKEYGNFDISFKPNDFDDENSSIFVACVDWENYLLTGRRHHEMRIGFDYKAAEMRRRVATWDHYGERTHYWQFIFGGGDVIRELSTEAFFLDLFFYIDRKLSLLERYMRRYI